MFTQMKSVVGDIGEMKIPLKPNARHVKHQTYRLYPKYKQKVNVELDRMLEERIIKRIEVLN